MLVAIDVDGTIDADPSTFLSLMQSLRAAGHKVAVLTGCSTPGKPTPADIAAKTQYLTSLGVGNAYDILKVVGDPTAEKKAKWCRKHNVALLIDNNVDNARMASDYCTVLLPWSTRTT